LTFFPTNAQTFAVEPARPEDAGDIFVIARRWDGSEAMLGNWWKFVPESFSAVKNCTDRIEGFYCMFGLDSDRQLLIGATEAGGATGSYSRWRFRYSSTEAVRD